MKRIYLDYAATTPARPEVVRAMLPFFDETFANPSTVYACGQEAKEAVERARASVASLIGARNEEIVFTSGGTESDNFAVKGVALANEHRGNHIITSHIEHHAVLETCKFLEKRGFTVTYLPVDRFGLLQPEDVRKAIKRETILISVMHANNEIGTIEPVAEIGRIAREAEVYFHTDAVQTAGHVPIDVDSLGVDLLSMSAHKLYGPKGVGGLYIKSGTRLVPFMHGGAQEACRRAGTENVPAIVGFGKAAELGRQEMGQESERLRQLRDRLMAGILERIASVSLNGHPQKRLPNNVNVGIRFVEGESILMSLDLEGICVSTGSACSSPSLEPSHVLLALGIPPQETRGAVRFSLGRWTTEEDVQRVLEVLPPVVTKLRAMSPLLKNREEEPPAAFE